MTGKRSRCNLIITIVMICIMLVSLTGCSAGAEQGGSAETGVSGAKGAEADNTEGDASGPKSMGRYLEKEVELPEEIKTMGSYPSAYLQKLDSGELAVLEKVAGLYLSEDNGESWKYKKTSWLSELTGKCYVSDVALSPNGAAVVTYTEYREEDEEPGYEPMYFYVDAEGQKTDIPFEEEDNYLTGFWFDKESHLYASDIGNRAFYEIDLTDMSFRRLFTTEGLVDTVCFTGSYIITFGTNEVNVYDRQEEIFTNKSEVFQNFVLENAGSGIGTIDVGHAVMALEGEQEDVIYFACSGGLYRYVMGGTVIEQVIDGSISSFGDPSMILCGLALLPDNEFVVLYNRVELYRYTYDPNVPTLPEEQITVYSLRDNYSIRQAVSLFQKENQNVYIRYEIGLSGDNSGTAEDAIKNLNTKIMSGSGPDILVLDGLPADSYKEKGIFADVSAVFEEMSGENSLFSNITEACREEGRIYAYPMRIQLPILVGKAEDIKNIKDLKTLADEVEKLREREPEGGILGFQMEEWLLYTLGQTSAAAWKREDGSLNQEALTEFLTEAARIYQADISGYDEEELRRKREAISHYSSEFAGGSRYYATASTESIDIAMGKKKMAVGKMYRVDFDFNIITTLAKQENLDYTFWQGQVKNGFIPDCMAGVYSGSAEKEQVMNFYRFLFGRKVQDMDLSGGFPVNTASFESFAKSPRAEEFGGGGLAMSSEDGGNMFSLDIEWTDAENFERLKEMMQSVRVISSGDATLEDIVYEVGVKALDGSMSVADAVKEIEKRAAIYLAE